MMIVLMCYMVATYGLCTLFVIDSNFLSIRDETCEKWSDDIGKVFFIVLFPILFPIIIILGVLHECGIVDLW